MFKRIILFLFIVTTIIAQDFTGIRIYINPGHGGHDSNDRYIAATGFWESEGNLGKGLHLRDILNSMNAITKMSRTTNNTNDDLGLSVIAADANNFDADYMHSIHSNAYNGQSNYTLILFQGKDNAPTYPEAKVMGGYLADEIFKAHRTSTKYNRGDADFYGTGQPYLGVFKGLTMPGTLSEGSFHDYIPESFRLKNDAYLDHEAWAITKAFIKYFNLDGLPYGEIAGVVRDAFNEVTYYSINSADKKKPANLVKATLQPGNKLYLGDSFNNGFFLFDKVEPGTYEIILEAENFEPDTVQAIVTAGKTTFADKYLIEKPDSAAPVVQNFLPEDTTNVRLDSDIILEFNVKMNRVSVEQSFSISPNITGTFSWENNDKRVKFSPSGFLQAGTSYTIKIGGFAQSYYNILIEQTFTKSFFTRSALTLLSAYPNQNAENISRTVKLIYKFDAPIDANKLGGNIFFQDINNVDVDLAIDEIDYDNGRIIFEPQKPLNANSFYQVKLLSGIKDIEGSNLGADTTMIFKTEPNINTDGNLLFDFEELGNWWQPQESETTSGIASNDTKFQISSKKFISGSHSGRLFISFQKTALVFVEFIMLQK
ncbi:MAG: Ig-like domain-containing protein [Ignavibacteriales bacterium]|nr:Ig-like domain-containing protein [Ignavibacteriales bacterium]